LEKHRNTIAGALLKTYSPHGGAGVTLDKYSWLLIFFPILVLVILVLVMLLRG